MKTIIILDTSALLKNSSRILQIIKQEQLVLILPSIVIRELDSIKDNKQHKECKNASKTLWEISQNHIKIDSSPPPPPL